MVGRGEHLLVVDDDHDIAAMCKEGFEILGYQVDVFTSSTQALEYFKTCYQDIDLVVTDQTMPEMTGIELAREMMDIWPDLPVILCSGYAASINNEAVVKAGIQRFVMKPVTVDLLSRDIQMLLNPQAV
ncbi:MAG: response regulator [Desulfobacter sp.]|nr:response regulator [Desulfobacter sp.]